MCFFAYSSETLSLVNGDDDDDTDDDTDDDDDDKANPLTKTLSAAQLHKVLHPWSRPG